MTRAVVLCADDYAFTTPISRAILDLAAAGRISALSCMTGSPHWPEHGRWLKGLDEKVDIGLHITLVDEAPLTKMPKTAPTGRLPNIRSLIIRSYTGQLDLGEIAAEIRAQAHAFESVMGFSPRHIDGHLHSHVLPGIGDVVLSLARTMKPRPWVRNIAERHSAIFARGVAVPKASFLAALGKRFAREAEAGGHAMNEGFSGIYAFSPNTRGYAALFEHFVESPRSPHLILCHPGTAQDQVAHSDLRAREHAFLSSGALPESLARRGLRLGRFAEAAHG